MLIARNGVRPTVSATARIAATAVVAGDVTLGAGCIIDHGAVIESSGPRVYLEDGVIVMPNSVIRSVGGSARPAFEARIGPGSLIGPLSSLVGCRLGADCYVATGVMVFQGAAIGDGTRLGAGCVVHVGTRLPAKSRVGLRQIAAPGDAGRPVVTGDLDRARTAVAAGDFFGTVFAADDDDQQILHRRSIAAIAEEMTGWDDEPIG